MNSPCSVTYLARMGGGTYHHKTFHSTFLRQHRVQLVQGPWQCHRDAACASSSVCQHRQATVPALLHTAALGGQFSSAVGPTVSLLPRKTQWGIFPLPLSSPVAPVQGKGWTLWEKPWCWAGSTEGPGSAASNGKPPVPWRKLTHNDGDWKLWV